MNRCLKYVVFGCLLAGGVGVNDMHAIPAAPYPVEVALPDGTTLMVQLRGDETSHYCLSEDGYPLLPDERGFFYYAQMNGAVPVRSQQRASNVALRSEAEKQFLQGIDKAAAVGLLQRGYAEKRQKSPLQKAVIGESSFPTKGSQRALAILVDFPKIGDNGTAVGFTVENPRQTFSDMLNADGFSQDGATGSVHDFYYDGSNGAFDLAFDVYGPVTLSNDISYYGTNETLHAWEMAVEACQQLDGEIDFTQYDRNKDGFIDNVYIFYAGQGEASGGATFTVWPHAGNIHDLTKNRYKFDGVELNHYACSNELRAVRNSSTQEFEYLLEGIGTVCHEFTHVLGFPDLYDTEDQSATFTPGAWSVMDVGSYNNLSHTPPTFSAYERYSLGWLTLTDLTEPADIILDNITKNVAYRIPTVNDNECFILENRQQQGWDTYLPGHGMLIWHIAYNADKWARNQVNIGEEYQGVDLEEADGMLSSGSRAGDAFPGTAGITSFTDDTKPGMLTQSGKHRTETPITDIEERNGLIHFKVKGGKSAVDGVGVLPASDITPISFVANWEESADAVAYKLDVYSYDADRRMEYVDGYEARQVETTSCLVEGLQPESTYYYRVKVVGADSESAVSESMEVATPTATFAYIAPEVSEASEITADSFLANWKPLTDADAYLVDVYRKEKGEADVITVDFTDKKLPDGWRTNCQMFLGTAGYYGEAIPSLSMSADYSYVESPVLTGNVRGLSFWYRERNNPSGNNKIVITGYVDGEWVTIDEMTLDASAQTASTASWNDADDDSKIPANCKAVRITYRLLGTGSLVIDDIRLSYNDNYREVPLDGWTQKNVGSATSVLVSGLEASTVYCYRVYGAQGDLMTIPSDEVAVRTGEAGLVAGLPADADVRIAANGRTLSVTANQECLVAVYDMQGRLVAEDSAAPAAIVVVPQAGVYVVKAGMTVRKIVVY